MKFRSERDSFADVLSTAGRAASGRGGASAVLSGLMLHAEGNRLEVTGTDLDLTIRVEHEVIGVEDGTCVIPARLTADVVRALEAGAVTLESDDDKVEISSARAHFGLRSFPAVEFPALPPPPEPSATLPRGALSEALRQVVRAASGDDARPLLTGVLMTTEGDAVRLVATDSYRLALRDLSGKVTFGEGADVLVPARALGELQRLSSSSTAVSETTDSPGTEVGVAASTSEITFTTGRVRISTRLLEGTYPDYRQLIPEQYPNRLHVGRESLLAALRRVRLLVRDSATPVRLSMRSGGVDLSVVSQEVGDASETVDGDFTGEDLVIAFNPSYLIDGVDAVLDDEVFVETDNPARPATVRAAGRDDFRYLLMPVRVS
ncbi:MAG: DNA polymerase III subunit beta [Acidimicrobiales bacterium]